MINYLIRRHHRFYKKNSWHLVLDLSSFIIVISLLVCLIAFLLYRPKIDLDYFGSTNSQWTVAPSEISFSLEKDKLALGEKIILKMFYKNNSLPLDSLKINFICTNADCSISPSNFILVKVSAGQSTEINIPLLVKNLTNKNNEINWQAEIEYKGLNKDFKEVKILPKIIILPELKATAKIYYNSPQGDQLGAGPIPPQVSLPTNYWVSLTALGASSRLENFVMSLALPKNVNYTDKKSLLAGNLKYNTGNRQIIWTIAQFSPDMQTQAGFEIQFIPSADQIGKVVDLLKNIQFNASDIQTGSEVGGSLYNLNTNLEFDRINKGQGKVE